MSSFFYYLLLFICTSINFIALFSRLGYDIEPLKVPEPSCTVSLSAYAVPAQPICTCGFIGYNKFHILFGHLTVLQLVNFFTIKGRVCKSVGAKFNSILARKFTCEHY